LTFTAEQREQAMHRATALVRFRAWRLDPAVHTDRDYPAFAADIERDLGLAVSRSQMYAWHDMAPGAGADLAAIALALVDRRGRPGGSRVHPSAWALFEELYLTPNQWSVAKCWRTVDAQARTAGWPWPSRRRIEQLVREKIDAGRACYHREGQSVWERRFKSPLEQDPEAFAPNQCWESDHMRLDFFAQLSTGGKLVGRRPWLTMWYDRRTRRIMGWWIDWTPCGDTIRWSLLTAIKTSPFGLPEIAWLDNGKDFRQAVHVGLTMRERNQITQRGGYWLDVAQGSGLLGMLGIEPHFAEVYNHNGKSRIEARFNFVHTDHDREYESWCGSKPGQRDKDTLDLVTAEAAQLPTLMDVRRRFAEWVNWYNARADHAIADLDDPETGERLSPDEYMRRHCGQHRVLRDPAALDLLNSRMTRPLSVGKSGVSLAIDGAGTLSYGDTLDELTPFKGTDRKVIVSYDPDDIRSVRIFDEQMRLVCIAPLNQRYGGVSRDPIKLAAMKAGRAQRKRQLQLARRQVDAAALVLPPAELAAREQRNMDLADAKARAATEPPRPDGGPVLRLVTTPIDGQSKAVQTAEDRLAARRGARIAIEPDDEAPIDLSRAVVVRDTDDDLDDDEPIDLSRTAPCALRDAHCDVDEDEHLDILGRLA